MSQKGNTGEIEKGPQRSFVARVKPARAHKAAMVIAQEIVHEISANNYEPGTKLPTEARDA